MKNKGDEQWLEVIKNRADEALHPVPEGAWENIARTLAESREASEPSVSASSRRVPLWTRWVAAAVVAAAVATASLFIVNDTTSPSEEPPTLAQVVEQPTPESAAEPLAAADSVVAPAAEPTVRPMSTPRTQPRVAPRYLAKNHVRDVREEVVTDDYEEMAAAFSVSDEFNDIAYRHFTEDIDNDSTEYYAQIEEEPLTLEPWQSISNDYYRLYLATDANAKRLIAEERERRDHQDDNNISLNTTGMLATHNMDETSAGNAAMLAPAFANTAAPAAHPASYNYSHKLPLTMGVNFNHRLWRNLVGSVGVNYSYLASDVTDDTSGEKFSQTVQLVGVPIGLNWVFWKTDHFTAYAGGELWMERMLKAKFDNQEFKERHLQWSVHAVAGMKYNFTPRMSLYVEPKVSHFMNTLPVTTLRDEHAIIFNLQFGVSVNF